GGIDVNHSDLKDNIWVNEIELNGTEGVDDDNNGYIDDINGFNFQAYKGEITPHFHGTHVAGTVSAVNNNGIGVAGIAGGSGNGDGARLMSCQIFNENNESGSFAAAIVYGADNGAVISQNSWGYSKPGAVEQVVLDAIDYFREEAGNYPGSPMKGGVVFFAAGNDGRDNVYYPGYYDGVISVAATGPSNVKSGYSNFGEWVDVAAPGGDQNLGLEAMILSTIPGEEYGFLQGTSMACPHISGVAALVVAKYGSEYFTNVDLESRILQGVNNIDASNPSYIGKIGSGLSDASKALTSNESTPPDGITDISVVGVSKDFAVLTWTVPTDPDDETPNKYFLYWSENNISEDSLSKIDFVVVNNNGNNVGDYIMAEVKGLKELTKYNFVAVASDRWGNTSELSKTVTTTTNEGSEIGTDLPSLSLDVDVSTSTQGGGTFHVLNQNDGILKWKLEQRNVRHTKSFSSVSYPINAKTITTSSALGKKEILKTEEVETVPYAQLQWVPSSIKYWTLTYPSYLFGSVDTTYTNSMATRFEINDEEGFNLTHVNAMLRGDAEDGPFIIEIYKGSSITDENRIYFDDKYYQLENNGENVIYRRIVELTENIFFNKDDVFWIVFHSPSNNKYPFGVYPETIESYSDNCIWSTDMGNTWVPLAQGMGSPDFVWGIDLVSSTDPLYKYVTVNPDKGELYGVDQQEIDFTVDATKLINGTYYSNMVFISNDELNPFYRVPLTVEVSGHKPLLSGPSIVEFGRVFNGLKKELRIPINNGGYGRFNTVTATSSDTQFKVVSSIGNINIDGLSSKDIKIEYTPNGIGNDNAEITLTSKNG
ncbi:MAG: S8 family serine peptidase, partial [Flavobacteriales bacterium]|nr:S8 family serine peptidase [Flavobacteriales bacterium]